MCHCSLVLLDTSGHTYHSIHQSVSLLLPPPFSLPPSLPPSISSLPPSLSLFSSLSSLLLPSLPSSYLSPPSLSLSLPPSFPFFPPSLLSLSSLPPSIPQFKSEMVDLVYDCAKFRYECGNYSEASEYLYFYRVLVSNCVEEICLQLVKGMYPYRTEQNLLYSMSCDWKYCTS